VKLPSPAEVTARLAGASALADLRPAQRLSAKLDLTPAGITRRLRAVSDLRDLCLRLGRLRPRGPE
jgi:hypothetical protein